MTAVYSFAPLAESSATILILGSMPGQASLRAGEYYAHPRNLFWPILGELVGAHPTLPYAERIRVLHAARIAVWDVLKTCRRQGSLDSDIEHDSLVTNDFVSFFLRHRKIAYVYFNGAKAEDCYRRYVLPSVTNRSLLYYRLPSTSPANASMSYRGRLAAWRVIAKPGPAVRSVQRRTNTACAA